MATNYRQQQFSAQARTTITRAPKVEFDTGTDKIKIDGLAVSDSLRGKDLKFADLTDLQKNELKLKFKDLTDADKKELKGDPGTSVRVVSKSVMYALGTSGTSAPASGWQDALPNMQLGKYVWSRTIINYSDGNSTTTYGITYSPRISVSNNRLQIDGAYATESLKGTDGKTFRPYLDGDVLKFAVSTDTGDASLASVATQSWVNGKGYALNSSIPTKLSQLTNDSGYATMDAVEGKGYITGSEASSTMASVLAKNEHNFVSYDTSSKTFTLCSKGTCQPINTGGTSVISDARMKDVTGEVVLSAEEIAALPAITFTYKSDKDKTPHCGSLAQEVRPVIPEAVGELPDGTLTMDYGGAAWVAVVNLAREVERLKGIIENLKMKMEN